MEQILTKKHFKAIADIIKNNTKKIDSEVFICNFLENKKFISDLSNYFKSLNENFNEDKFKIACLN